jgi:DnaJ family protein C protein 7
VRAEFLKEQGNVQYKKGLYGTALDFYKKAVDTAPSVGKYYGNKAACETMLAKHWNAAQTCKKGLEMEPGMVKLRVRLCTALVHQGKIGEALESLAAEVPGASAADQKALDDKKAEVTKLQSMWDTAKGYLAEKKYGAANTSLKNVEKQVTACELVSLQISECCVGLRNFSEAGKITQTLISNNRSCIDAYVLRAEALYYLDGGGQRSEAQAVNHLQAALRMDPDHARAAKRYKQIKLIISEKERLQNEAKKCIGAKKFTEAVVHLNEALKLDPEDHGLLAKLHVRKAEAEIGLGKALKSEGPAKEAQAEKALKDAMRSASSATYFKEDMMQGYLWKVKALQLLGDYQKAVEEMEEVAKGVGRGDPSVSQHLKHAKLELKKSKRKNYYTMLGITESASASDIKRGYKKSAMKWHPDRHSMSGEEGQKMAEQRFKDIGEANDVLSDASSKRLYDQGYDIEEIKQRTDQQEHYAQHRGGGGHHGGFGGGFGGFGGF